MVVPFWPLYDTQKVEILDTELDSKSVVKPDPRKARFNVIEKVFKQSHRQQLHAVIYSLKLKDGYIKLMLL